MWSHYSNKHKGYVLGFDENHQWFNPPSKAEDYIGKVIPVSYSKERFEMVKAEMNLDTAMKPFFVKSKDWEYESESRVLLPLAECTEVAPEMFTRDYPSEMLKEVIFGFRCPQEIIIKIKDELKDREVAFLRAMPSSISFDVELQPEEDYFETIEEKIAHLKKQAESGGIDLSILPP